MDQTTVFDLKVLIPYSLLLSPQFFPHVVSCPWIEAPPNNVIFSSWNGTVTGGTLSKNV